MQKLAPPKSEKGPTMGRSATDDDNDNNNNKPIPVFN
jgi:hypothetical protein